jgi:hypothetical protein
MKKTLNLINHYIRVIEEQGEQMPENPEEMEGFDSSGGESVVDNPEPIEDETMPLTSEGEDRYISDLIDAALFEPTPDDALTLQNLQSVMKMKRYKNARQEVLPLILGLIRPETEVVELRDDLNEIS